MSTCRLCALSFLREGRGVNTDTAMCLGFVMGHLDALDQVDQAVEKKTPTPKLCDVHKERVLAIKLTLATMPTEETHPS
jgi:hypothetical protein